MIGTESTDTRIPENKTLPIPIAKKVNVQIAKVAPNIAKAVTKNTNNIAKAVVKDTSSAVKNVKKATSGAIHSIETGTGNIFTKIKNIFSSASGYIKIFIILVVGVFLLKIYEK